MKNDALQTLAAQLKLWADFLILSIPGPIRVVEALPQIITACGVVSPPLVLWINRENRIAAGVILSVRSRVEGEVLAATVTDALAINHAALWLPDALILIQIKGDGWIERANISLAHLNEEGVALAREAFVSLYKEIQHCAVTGMTLPNKISSSAIANIFLSLINTSMKGHERTLLIDGVDEVDREKQAISEAILDLLLLLQADVMQLLPEDLLAEEIDAACRVAISSFHGDIARVYSTRTAPLDGKTLHRARFRLKQLGLQESIQRIGGALKILSLHFAPILNCRTVSLAEVMINPDHIPNNESSDGSDGVTIVAPAPMALLLLLADQWLGYDRVKGFSTDLFAVKSGASFSGFFSDGDKPTPEMRLQYQTRLRQSWPTRRFKLPPSAPDCIYYLIHSLGVSTHVGATNHIVLSNFNKSRGGMFLLDMLNHVSLRSLKLMECGELEIITVRSKDSEPVDDAGEDGEDDVQIALVGDYVRQVQRVELQQGETTLAVALLPEELFQLHRQGDLVLAQTLSTDVGAQHIGLLNQFVKSRLGRYLWSELIGGAPPKANVTIEQLSEKRLLVPSLHILRTLADRLGEAEDRVEARVDIDKIVTKLYGLSVPYVVQRKRATSKNALDSEDALAEKRIEGCLAAQGIPSFPDQYCYQFSNIDYDEYTINSELTLGGSFLDECELIDSEGKILSVTGEERAHALLLASQGKGSSIRLPQDRLLIKKICSEYIEDLKGLRQLSKECGASDGTLGNLDKKIDTVWQKMGLPPWHIVLSVS